MPNSIIIIIASSIASSQATLEEAIKNDFVERRSTKSFLIRATTR